MPKKAVHERTQSKVSDERVDELLAIATKVFLKKSSKRRAWTRWLNEQSA
jgi:hypothetical protein